MKSKALSLPIRLLLDFIKNESLFLAEGAFNNIMIYIRESLKFGHTTNIFCLCRYAAEVIQNIHIVYLSLQLGLFFFFLLHWRSGIGKCFEKCYCLLTTRSQSHSHLYTSNEAFQDIEKLVTAGCTPWQLKIKLPYQS